MLATALYVALGCAVISALAGNRTAWAMVPAVVFCLWMQAEEVAFSRAFWFAIDVAVIALIYGLNKKLRPADWAILALFPVAWVLYGQPDPYRYIGTTLITIAQLLLTFPARRFGLSRVVARWKANFQHRDEWTDLERRGQRGINA